VDSDDITVSDPRPPTAELKLTLPPWVKPGAAVPISATAMSYIGTQVNGVSMTVVWNTPKAKGNLTITTDTNGTATGTIDLGALPPKNATQSGDTLTVNVEWIGPTRERITQRGTTSIQAAARRVNVQRNLDTVLPGVPFGVEVSVSSNEDGSELPGVPVSVTLSPKVIDPSGGCNTTSSCPTNLLSGSTDPAACQLSLHCIGQFILKACTADAQEQACTNITIGQNSTEWDAAPLSGYDSLSFKLAPGPAPDGAFDIGSTATLRLQNPWQGASLLLLWGNHELSQKLTRTQLPAGPLTFNISVGYECRGGCTVMALMSVPRLVGSSTPAVPTSKLFDPLAPHSHSYSTQLNVRENRSLNVSAAVASPNQTAAGVPSLAPGAQAPINVSVSFEGKPVPNAEVTIVAVDKAILDLVPYSLRDVAASVVLRLAADLSANDDTGMRVAPAAIPQVFAAALRRLLADPWVIPVTNVQPPRYPWKGQGKAPVDLSDEDYLAMLTSYLTYQSNRARRCSGTRCSGGDIGIAMDMVMAAMPMSKGAPGNSASRHYSAESLGETANDGSNASAGPPAATAPTSVRMQSEFVATPLFVAIRTAADGSGSVMFNAPPNLGTFVVRAYAVDGARALYGSSESKVVVRRVLSLTPSVPRFVRVGDKFEAGVIVTATALEPGAAPFPVTVTLQLTAPAPAAITLVGVASGQATLSPSSPQQEVRFRFSADAIGNATLLFSASDSQGASDALQLSLDVKEQQTAVAVATSFSLRGDDGVAPWQEGLDLPAAVPRSGSLDLIAGVGHLPAVNTMFQQTAEHVSRDYPSSYDAMALATWPSILSYYNQQLPGSAEPNVSFAFQTLSDLNTQQYGLLSSMPRGWSPNRANIVLNAWAAWLTTVHKAPTDQRFQGAWRKVVDMAGGWKQAAAVQLLQDAMDARQYSGSRSRYSDFYSIAWTRLAMGSGWSAPLCDRSNSMQGSARVCASSQDVQSDVSLERLVQEAPKQGLTVQLLTSLTLQAAKSSDPLITKTLDQVLSNLRVQGRTAYVSASPGGRSPAGLEVQALALRLLMGATPAQRGSEQLVQKLAAYVASEKAPEYLPFLASSRSPMAVSLAGLALSGYDVQVGSATPNLDLTASVAGTTLLSASFTGSNTSLVGSSTPWEDLPSPPGVLDFNVSGTGEASLAVSLTFVPQQLLTFPTYRGIWVEAAIQLQDPLTGGPTGGPLRKVPLASVVVITIQITTPDDLGPVTVEALMPGGLEPLDPNVATDVTSSCALGGLSINWRSAFWWWWWPVCPSQETRPSVVTFHYDYLTAGTSVLEIKAVAATVGEFVLPPIKAYADRQPEVMGMTAGGNFSVCATGLGAVGGGSGACGVELLPLAQAPVACPNNCSGNGACNLDTGACICNNRFSGSDCSTIEV